MCVREVLWLCKFAGLLKIVLPGEIVDKLFKILIGEDNMACIQNTHISTNSDLCKHVDVKYQLLIDHMKRNVSLPFIPTEKMVADVMTGKLKCIKFAELVKLTKMC